MFGDYVLANQGTVDSINMGDGQDVDVSAYDGYTPYIKAPQLASYLAKTRRNPFGEFLDELQEQGEEALSDFAESTADAAIEKAEDAAIETARDIGGDEAAALVAAGFGREDTRRSTPVERKDQAQTGQTLRDRGLSLIIEQNRDPLAFGNRLREQTIAILSRKSNEDKIRNAFLQSIAESAEGEAQKSSQQGSKLPLIVGGTIVLALSGFVAYNIMKD